MVNLKEKWSWYFILAFLIIRLLLNLMLVDIPLHLGFSISYIILIFLMFKAKAIFPYLLITFLYVDSLIGTYLWTSGALANWDYLGTMILHLFIILLVLIDKNKIFWKR